MFVRGYCIVGSLCSVRMELISCSRSVQVRHMNGSIYVSRVVLWMKPGGENLDGGERKDLRSSSLCSLWRTRIFKSSATFRDDNDYHVKRPSSNKKNKASSSKIGRFLFLVTLCGFRNHKGRLLYMLHTLHNIIHCALLQKVREKREFITSSTQCKKHFPKSTLIPLC